MQAAQENTQDVIGERRASDAIRIAAALRQSGRVSLRVRGASMLPWVRPGDIAVIRHASPDSIRCGDVVLFRRYGRLFVHRIVEKRGSWQGRQFCAKGDAHPHSDGRLQPDELLGRVVYLYRGWRRIDLEAPGQLALGVLISQLSLYSRLWYPLARCAGIAMRPVRRVLNDCRVSGAAVR